MGNREVPGEFIYLSSKCLCSDDKTKTDLLGLFDLVRSKSLVSSHPAVLLCIDLSYKQRFKGS